MCEDASRILNAIKRQGNFIIATKMRTMVANTYVLSQFNYCPLVWHFCGPGATHKIERIQERVLRFVHNDYTSDYTSILNKSNTTTFTTKGLK